MSHAEENVLGAVVTYKLLFDTYIQNGLSLDMFSDIGNKETFAAIIKARARFNTIDALKIEALDIDDLLQENLFRYAIRSEYTDEYFVMLEKEYLQRKAAQIFSEIKLTRAGCSEVAMRMALLSESGHTLEQSLESMIDNAVKMINERSAPSFANKYETALSLDDLGHYEKGTLVTLGGGSGHGKTTLALNMAAQWLSSGLKVLIFSNEMCHEFILIKMACIRSGQQWSKVMHSFQETLNDTEKAGYIKRLKAINKVELSIFEHPLTLPEMRLVLKAHKPDVFILDTINALIADDARTDIALGKVARELKSMAVELESLAVIIAQLKDIRGRPTDKNLIKESRQIRDASDYMDFIYREGERGVNADVELVSENNEADVFEVYRVKGRLTGVGNCLLKINLQNGQIEDFNAERSMYLKGYFRKNHKRLFKEYY